MLPMRRLPAMALVAVCAALAAPVHALADDDPDDVRREARCSGSSEVSLRLRADDGLIRVELEIDVSRRGPRWNVILLHERRIAFRGTLRPRSSSGDLRLRRTVRDLFGRDSFVVRASGPRAETCRVAATI